MESRILIRCLLLAISLAVTGAALPAGAQSTGRCSDEVNGAQRANPLVVHFPPAQSALRNDDEKRLAQLARLARSHDVQEICVQGFAERDSDPALSQLSMSRGQAVAQQLSRHGVDPRTIVIDPYGQPGPSIAAAIDEATESDRRVEVRFSRH